MKTIGRKQIKRQKLNYINNKHSTVTALDVFGYTLIILNRTPTSVGYREIRLPFLRPKIKITKSHKSGTKTDDRSIISSLNSLVVKI